MIRYKILSFLIFIFCIPHLGCEKGHEIDANEERWWTKEEQNFIISELNRSTKALHTEINSLSDEQWNFHESPARWSIGEIVEHLEMQNQLHFREISVMANAPQQLQLREVTLGQDGYFTQYSADTTRSTARWFLQPKGKFCNKHSAEEAFYKARLELTQLVINTKIDFRKQFTYRSPVESVGIDQMKIGQVRDLHQLLLTGIAHTDRHIRQIMQIKSHTDFPK